MSQLDTLSQWETTVSRYMPHLSRPQAYVLALWSYGMVLAKSCGITSVAALLARLLDVSYSTMRQRLREWCYDAEDKKGEKRQEVDVTLCFAPLLSWVLSWWSKQVHNLALGMDATTRASRFTVLAISVLYRGCAIPVAWKIVRSHEKGSWEPYWKELFTVLQASVPKGWTVIVLADRGLYAPWLFKHIVAVGWHPFLRINLGGKVRPVGTDTWLWLSTLVPQTGTAWSGYAHGLRNEVVEEFEKRKEMCFLRRKEKREYFLLRRHYEQYRIFCDKYPDLARISAINSVVVGRGSNSRALSQNARSA